MSTEITTRSTSSLAIQPGQRTFTDQQRAALEHMGVESATPADLAVFFHVCQRTGLDPFARQIYMISRKSRGEVKQTIQTGIDGYRLIGHRVADARSESISVSAPEWAHEDGSWRPLWSAKWGLPLAARITIERAGHPFTAVALFDEYKQTKYDGGLTQMWAQRPAGQIAKCAEALAWRMAFPQDLAGIYVDEEMDQADNPARSSRRDRDARPTGASILTPAPAPEPVRLVAEEAMTDHSRREMFALLAERGITDEDAQRAGMSRIIGRQVTSRGSLTEDEARAVIASLRGGPIPESAAPAPAEDWPEVAGGE